MAVAKVGGGFSNLDVFQEEPGLVSSGQVILGWSVLGPPHAVLHVCIALWLCLPPLQDRSACVCGCYWACTASCSNVNPKAPAYHGRSVRGLL